MGWGLTISNVPLFPKRRYKLRDLFLSRITKESLEQERRELEDLIKMYKNELIALAAYTGEKYFDGDQQWGLVEYVSMRVPGLVDDLCEYSWKLFLIEHAINCPEDVIADI